MTNKNKRCVNNISEKSLFCANDKEWIPMKLIVALPNEGYE